MIKIFKVCAFLSIFALSGCTGNPVKDAGCLLGVTQFVEMTGSMSANTSCFRGLSSAGGSNSNGPSGSEDADAYARKLMVKCYMIAYSNWTLELPTLNETYSEIERTTSGTRPGTEAKNAMRTACDGDERTEQGLAVVSKCVGETPDCRAKARLAQEMDDAITSLTPSEVDTRIGRFIRTERKKLSQKSY